jgi:hypothetical protein
MIQIMVIIMIIVIIIVMIMINKMVVILTIKIIKYGYNNNDINKIIIIKVIKTVIMAFIIIFVSIILIWKLLPSLKRRVSTIGIANIVKDYYRWSFIITCYLLLFINLTFYYFIIPYIVLTSRRVVRFCI